MDEVPFRIVQMSDMHLFVDVEQALLGVKTQESFDAVVDFLKADQRPDLIILSGDLSQDGSKAAYIRLADQLKEFPIPIYYVVGNHDDTRNLNSAYPLGSITHHCHIVLKNWHIILLNSQKPGAVEGFLDASQLTFLQHCLQMYPEHHAIVVCHHQPIPVGCEWLDRLGLTNAAELWAVLNQFSHVNTVLFGHVHQEHAGKKNGIQYYSPPSTCIQFKTNSAKFALEKLPPGYRWIDIFSDGTLKTGIRRVAEYVGGFDADAKGY